MRKAGVMETIHKKNGRLHIYVRQDKYKGELKSHNWVGRTYINGKQKVFSSGTTDLEKATSILEKWFDDLHITKEQIKETSKAEDNIPKAFDDLHVTKEQSSEIPKVQDNTSKIENDIPIDINQKNIQKEEYNIPKEEEKEETNNSNQSKPPTKDVRLSMFEKLKNIKFSKLSLGKKNIQNKDSQQPSKQNKFKKILSSFFKSKLSRMSVTSEEIVGIDVTREAVRVAQVSKDKNDKWILDKFSYRLLDKEKVGDNLLDSKDYASEEINLAVSNAKISTKNAAISIPYTSAIIRTLTSPLMDEQELKQAIETESLWDNLVQIADLNDYSVFHQVINRDSKKNTMQILFVASKLSDVNSYASMVKKAGLNPVIMDVRCFTLKNAYDNSIPRGANKVQPAIMEFGLDENYMMTIYNNTPIITDIFLRPQEKQTLLQVGDSNFSNSEIENVIRRYIMQVKQALSEHENKYETKINKITVVSSLKNIKQLLPVFKKNLPNTGFELYDPLFTISIPTYNKEKLKLENKSTITSVLGLAYRKLDVFGYYKFVTAVKNINLLPNRDAVRQQNKIKFLSGFAFKGLAATIAAIYLILIGYSLILYNSNKEKLKEFAEVEAKIKIINAKYEKLTEQKNKMDASIAITNMINSNQEQSFRALAQVARSVPTRMKLNKIEYNGEKEIIIRGLAFDPLDVINFNATLKRKSLIVDSEIKQNNRDNTDQSKSKSMKYAFEIRCTLDFSENRKKT